MSLDIRENVISKIKNDTENDIIAAIDESVVTGNELVLPGLGVMMELFWTNLDKNLKMNIASIIKKNITNK